MALSLGEARAGPTSQAHLELPVFNEHSDNTAPGQGSPPPLSVPGAPMPAPASDPSQLPHDPSHTLGCRHSQGGPEGGARDGRCSPAGSGSPGPAPRQSPRRPSNKEGPASHNTHQLPSAFQAPERVLEGGRPYGSQVWAVLVTTRALPMPPGPALPCSLVWGQELDALQAPRLVTCPSVGQVS